MANIKGYISAVAAFILWGVLPVYWKALDTVPAYEILCHRIFWSLIVTLLMVQLTGGMKVFRQALTVRKNLATCTVTGLLLSVNWLLFIWAVNAGFILEASLGYFINPLLNVFCGMIFFKEKMRPLQWLALFCAFLGVLYLTVYYGRFPWIALALAFCFTLYGVLHKKSSLASLDALCLETGIIFVPAALVLVAIGISGEGAFGQIGVTGSMLLIGAGLVTTIPLLFFGYAARQIPLSTLGLIQYLAPTINLILGVVIYREDFPQARFIGFSMVWGGLLLFIAENLLRRYTNKRAVKLL